MHRERIVWAARMNEVNRANQAQWDRIGFVGTQKAPNADEGTRGV